MKDATVEIIGEVRAHPDADRLDLVKVLGFQCVTQRGLYQGGEKIVYVRPDAVLPLEPWAEEYRKYSPKRIKAVRLRGEWSEGIIVPLEILPVDLKEEAVGSDVSEKIGVFHYEPPVPQDLQAKGPLPLGIPKTDEERWENLIDVLPSLYGKKVDVTLKVDGQSCSFFYDLETDTFGVLGRNLEMKPKAPNNYTAHLERYGIREKLINYCKEHGLSLVIRGESYGAGIQGSKNNPHAKVQKGWAMFSTYDIQAREYFKKGSNYYFIGVANEMGLPHVPILESDVELTMDLIEKYSSGIDEIDGKPFEGVVLNHEGGTFKVINKPYDSQK